MRTKELFKHKFENGNEVCVTNKGVTLWDTRSHQWVIDASTVAEDSTYRVAYITGEPHEYPSLYQDTPKKKPKVGKKRRVANIK